jgi:voltage-gated potassium channel Kch
VNVGKRIVKSSAISYLSYFLILLVSVTYLAYGLKYGLKIPQQSSGLVDVLFIILIFSSISLWGMIVRARYSFYIGISTLVATILSFLLLNGFALPYLYPLLIISIVSLYFLSRRYKYYSFPSRLFDRPEISVSIVIIFLVLFIGVVGTLILGDQFRPKIDSVETALYYTGEIVTTLGFGDILPVTKTAQLFSIAMSMIGIGSFFGAVTVIVAPSLYSRGKRVVGFMQKSESRRMEDYVFFVDFSDLLEPLLDYLIENDELVVIGTDDRSREEAFRDRRVFVEYDTNIERTLSSFDLRKAKRVILGSKDDGKNIMTALFIRSVFPEEEIKKKIIAVVNVSSNSVRLKPLVGEIINPAELIAKHSKELFQSA